MYHTMHSLCQDFFQHIYYALPERNRMHYRLTCKTIYYSSLIITNAVQVDKVSNHSLRAHMNCLILSKTYDLYQLRVHFPRLEHLKIHRHNITAFDNHVIQCQTLYVDDDINIVDLGPMKELACIDLSYRDVKCVTLPSVFSQLQKLTVRQLTIDQTLSCDHLRYLKVGHLTINTHQPFHEGLACLIVCLLKCDFTIQWPQSLTHLFIDGRIIFKSLPARLVLLNVWHAQFQCKIPETLKTFISGLKSCKTHAKIFPACTQCYTSYQEYAGKQNDIVSVKKLDDNLNSQISQLTVTTIQKPLDKSMLPQSLTKLTICRVHKCIRCLPDTLLFLKITYCSHALCKLPDQLQTLILHQYNFPFKHALPDTLEHIQLTCYNHVYSRPWPTFLKYLHLSFYNQSFPQSLPSTLHTLKLNSFNQAIGCGFPKDLAYLEMPCYNQPLRVPFASTSMFINMKRFTKTFFHPWPTCMTGLIKSKSAISFYPWPENMQVIEI